jgi:hypothetical protein
MQYRACYYHSANGQNEIVLTVPENTELSDSELVQLTIQEAHTADIVGEEWPRIPLDELKAGLRIGPWKE